MIKRYYIQNYNDLQVTIHLKPSNNSIFSKLQCKNTINKS